jgi:hypothetical protein
MSGSLTILGSTQGTVDGDGNYEANGNFLGEISGQDIIDLNKTRQDQRDAEENERNPVKSAKDAKDGATNEPEEGPSGLVDLAFAGLGVVMSAGAAFLAGGGSGSASPSVPTGGQSGAGNGGNASTVGRKPEDEKDGKVKGDVDTTDKPQKKQPTKEDDPKKLNNRTGNEDNANIIKDSDIDFVNEMLGKVGLAGLVATDIPKPAKNTRQSDSENTIDLRKVKTVDELVKKLKDVDPSLSDREINNIRKGLLERKGYEDGKIPVNAEKIIISRDENGKLNITLNQPYTVQKGEVLNKIAYDNDVNPRMIARENSLTGNIHPGQKIEIPVKNDKDIPIKTNPLDYTSAEIDSMSPKRRRSVLESIQQGSNNNPNLQEVKDHLSSLGQKDAHFQKLVQALIYTETGKKTNDGAILAGNGGGYHYNEGVVNVGKNPENSAAKKPLSSDIGLLQLNDHYTVFTGKDNNELVDIKKLATDWKYNLEVGTSKLDDAFKKAKLISTDTSSETFLKALYQAYNTGNPDGYEKNPKVNKYYENMQLINSQDEADKKGKEKEDAKK